MLHKALQNKWVRVLIAVFATFLYALGVNLFIVPMGLYSGGVVGLSQVIRTLLMQHLDLPAGVDIAGILYFLINIPVLYLAWRDLGRGFLLRTLICVGASSFFLSVVRSPAVPILEDPLASCLVGGILCGFALGLALTCGCSTGGLDVVGLCLTKRGSRFTVGRFSLSFNIMLYVACAFLFDLRTAIYSVIYTVFCALFIDRGHQQNINVQVLIFTKDTDPALPQRPVRGRQDAKARKYALAGVVLWKYGIAHTAPFQIFCRATRRKARRHSLSARNIHRAEAHAAQRARAVFLPRVPIADQTQQPSSLPQKKLPANIWRGAIALCAYQPLM